MRLRRVAIASVAMVAATTSAAVAQWAPSGSVQATATLPGISVPGLGQLLQTLPAGQVPQAASLLSSLPPSSLPLIGDLVQSLPTSGLPALGSLLQQPASVLTPLGGVLGG